MYHQFQELCESGFCGRKATLNHVPSDVFVLLRFSASDIQSAYHGETKGAWGQVSGRGQPVVANEKDQQEHDDSRGVQSAQRLVQKRHPASQDKIH